MRTELRLQNKLKRSVKLKSELTANNKHSYTVSIDIDIIYFGSHTQKKRDKLPDVYKAHREFMKYTKGR